MHFTHIKNLNSILSHGLLGRDKLKAISTKKNTPVFNDLLRLDGCPDAVCLSISFPNPFMFNKYSYATQKDWVVLTLSPAILWELDCAFCLENAASHNIRTLGLDSRRQAEAFESLFTDQNGINREDLHLADCYPTHPQAEVLVFDSIPTDYIQEVHFSDSVAYRKKKKLFDPETSKKFSINTKYFSQRCDQEYRERIVREHPAAYNVPPNFID